MNVVHLAKMADLPTPLVPSDIDCRELDYMPLYGARLLDSDTWALCNAEEKVAALTGWWKSWHQLPAGTLPSDDRLLSHLLGYGVAVEAFQRVKTNALRGWVLCSDGRLHHPILGKIAIESWYGTAVHRWKRECDRLRKENKEREAAGDEPLPTPSKPTHPKDRHSAGNPPDHDTISSGSPPETACTSVRNPGLSVSVSISKKEEGDIPLSASPIETDRKKATNKREYAFEGRVIRLIKADYDRLKKSYPKYGDSFDGELAAIDAKFSDEPPDNFDPKKWYGTLTGWLKKRHSTLPELGAASGSGNGHAFVDPEADQWRERVRSFVARGRWRTEYGPKPLSDGCLCPPEILAEFREKLNGKAPEP